MKNTTTIFDIFQIFLTAEEVKKVRKSLGDVDKISQENLLYMI